MGWLYVSELFFYALKIFEVFPGAAQDVSNSDSSRLPCWAEQETMRSMRDRNQINIFHIRPAMGAVHKRQSECTD